MLTHSTNSRNFRVKIFLTLLALTMLVGHSVQQPRSTGAVVSKVMVDNIKEITTDWEPMDPEENPLKDLDADELIGLLGV